MLPDVYGLERDQRARLRPIGITILAALFGFSGVGLTFSGFASLIGWFRTWGQLHAINSSVAMPLQVLRGFVLLGWVLVGLSMLIVNVGMLRVRLWAWWSGLVLYAVIGGIQLLGFLIITLRSGLATALPSGVVCLMAVVAISYLLQPRIRTVFFR